MREPGITVRCCGTRGRGHGEEEEVGKERTFMQRDQQQQRCAHVWCVERAVNNPEFRLVTAGEAGTIVGVW